MADIETELEKKDKLLQDSNIKYNNILKGIKNKENKLKIN